VAGMILGASLLNVSRGSSVVGGKYEAAHSLAMLIVDRLGGGGRSPNAALNFRDEVVEYGATTVRPPAISDGPPAALLLAACASNHHCKLFWWRVLEFYVRHVPVTAFSCIAHHRRTATPSRFVSASAVTVPVPVAGCCLIFNNNVGVDFGLRSGRVDLRLECPRASRIKLGLGTGTCCTNYLRTRASPTCSATNSSRYAP